MEKDTRSTTPAPTVEETPKNAQTIDRPKFNGNIEVVSRSRLGSSREKPLFTDTKTKDGLASLITAIGTILLLAATIIFNHQQVSLSREATGAACKAAEAAQQQTDLLREQLIGTQAAIIFLDSPGLAGHGGAQLTFTNQGHVNGSVSASFDVVRVFKTGAEAVILRDSFKNLLVPYGNQHALVRHFSITEHEKGFSEEEVTALYRDTRRQTLIVRGKFSYNNGFSTTYPPESFCYSFLANPQVSYNTGTAVGGGASFVPCGEWAQDKKGYYDSLKEEDARGKRLVF